MIRIKIFILGIFIIFQSCNNANEIHGSQTDPAITEEYTTEEYTMSTPLDSDFVNNTYVDYNSTEEYTVSTPMGNDNNDDYETLNAYQDDLENLTPDDVEVYLYRNDTLEFLSTFQPGHQRDVIRNQLKYCPFNRLCGFSFNLPNSWMTCCQACSCTFPTCVKDKTCCPDILFRHANGFSDTFVTEELPKLLEGQKVQKDCIYLYLTKSFLTYKKSAYGYATCPIGTESELHINCTRSYNADVVSELVEAVPVISRETNELYRNMYCAFCNGLSMYDFERLDAKLMCRVATYFTTDTDILNAVFVEGKCDIEFSTEHKLNSCFTSVSGCSVTGTFEETVCSTYRSAIYIDEQLFQNIFCSICNGVLPRSLTCPLGSMQGARNFAFSGLLKLDKVDAVLDIRSSNNRDMDKCSEDQLYDKILDSCKDLVCSAISVLNSGKCVDLFTNLEKITYTVFLRLKPVNPLSIKNAYIVAGHVIAHMEEFLDGSELCGMQIIYKPNVSLSKTDLSFVESSNLLYFDARVWFHIFKRHDPNQIVAKLMRLHDSNQTFRINNSTGPVTFKFQVKDDSPERFDQISFLSQSNDESNDSEISSEDYEFVLLPNLIAYNYEGICAIRKQDFNIIEITTCPKIELSASDLPWKEEEKGITFPIGHYVLKSNEYYFIDEDHIMVCADTYKHYLTQIPQEESDTSLSVESIISIACSTVSILALSFTFFVYCFFSKLRGTIPGKNNMSLVFTLLLAQTLYLTGSFSNFKRNSTECLLFGILIHWSWLVALLWMNICTFHMFRVLARTKVMSQSSGTRRLVIYQVYAQSMAAIFVSINIGVSYVMNGDFGYGTETCYISSQRMIIYTFGIPAACVVISNLSMFTFVIIKIKRTPSVQKNVQNERNDLIVFAKLSTITGATWVFGFLYMWTSSTALSYMFIVLNASQGLFIMFAFVINKRVYDLFRGQVLGLTVTSSESRRPTSKTSIKMSDKL
ncbi:uncharacterized protein LOC123552138 [Mercenaria mercenaria]|uniref:uncharacterized protein LOC123552138 n=1 Tax=Mercenaria mercenaria TaxID=6596 RepID=UPI00234F6C5B|nr:uncharacterized protein LOC123552138 [Mercenaria mercenaria]